VTKAALAVGDDHSGPHDRGRHILSLDGLREGGGWHPGAALCCPGRVNTTQRESLRLRVSWIALLVPGLATLAFGLVAIAAPGQDGRYLRAIGGASVGMGLFGSLVTVTAFRRRERWAFFALCYYPVFWTAHLVGNLPPGQDHVHQVVFILLSLLGLLLPLGEFFPRRASREAGEPG
jgi:hypothetical protein